MRFSHIIATKGRPMLLREALTSAITSLAADGNTDGEIIVVDGDPERSGEAVMGEMQSLEDCPPVRYMAGVSGLCAQRNAGLSVARGEVAIFTDDDCTLAKGFYNALDRAYRDSDVVGATGRVLRSHEERIGSDVESPFRRLVLGGGRQGTMTSFGFRRPIVDVDSTLSVEYMPGTFMSARLAMATELGFDEWLQRSNGYCLGEDDDFSYRLSRRGTIAYVPSAAVYHRSLGKLTMDRREFDRLVVVNRTYIFRKNFAGTPRAKLGFAGSIFLFFGHRVLNRDWQGMRGLIDGLRDVWGNDLGREEVSTQREPRRRISYTRFPRKGHASPMRINLGRRLWVRELERIRRRQSVVLGYHGIAESRLRDDLSLLLVSPERFRGQLDLLRDAGFQFVTMAELARRANGGVPPPGLAVVTFDDGMRNNHAIALPILREFGIPATVYVTIGFIGAESPWIGAGADSAMMSEPELRELTAAGWELGAHTVTHPDLSTLDYDACRREIEDSRKDLERIAGATVQTFAYPFGRYGPAALAAVEDTGLLAAVTTGSGSWSRYEITRAMIGAIDPLPIVLLKLTDHYQPLLRTAPARVARRATRRLRGDIGARPG